MSHIGQSYWWDAFPIEAFKLWFFRSPYLIAMDFLPRDYVRDGTCFSASRTDFDYLRRV